MTVAELCAQRRFRLTDEPVPEPKPGEVQARVEAVGICGSDLHNFMEGQIGDTPSVYPMVLGHEPAGVITKVGAGVTGWSAGDAVVLEPAIYCYHCEYCLTGHHNVCEKIRFMSMPGDPGYLREFVTLPATNLLPMPRNLSFREATVFEPLAIILHSMKFVDPRPGETAVVFGAGPIGLLTIAVLKMCGAHRVYAVEPVKHRRELAMAMGADAAIDPKSEDVAAFVRRETGGRGVDAAVDCAAKDNSINLCLHVTRNAGRVVITGIPCEVVVPLEFHTLRRKELAFYSVRRSNHESATALRMMTERPQFFAPMLTHARRLEDVQTAFDTLEHYADGVGKMSIVRA